MPHNHINRACDPAAGGSIFEIEAKPRLPEQGALGVDELHWTGAEGLQILRSFEGLQRYSLKLLAPWSGKGHLVSRHSKVKFKKSCLKCL
jgi:hypothetical protein